ncbi:MAG: hypothetical protein D5R99_09185 [Methanocalculus sp. MSAO_Arc1]|nr:MAG: hypothetical protein D5R99_09185 [Methanocalculus sp. MSAO_Arc1]
MSEAPTARFPVRKCFAREFEPDCRRCWRGRGGNASVWLSEEIRPDSFGIAFQVALMSTDRSALPACLFRRTPPPYTRAAPASLIPDYFGCYIGISTRDLLPGSEKFRKNTGDQNSGEE